MRDWSYGIGQINPETLAELINKGYYPSVPVYNGDADGFIDKRALYLEIMDDSKNPAIIKLLCKKKLIVGSKEHHLIAN